MALVQRLRRAYGYLFDPIAPPPGFHPPPKKHVYYATAVGATIWFWLLVRIKEDGPALLVSPCRRHGAQDPAVP